MKLHLTLEKTENNNNEQTNCSRSGNDDLEVILLYMALRTGAHLSALPQREGIAKFVDRLVPGLLRISAIKFIRLS